MSSLTRRQNAGLKHETGSDAVTTYSRHSQSGHQSSLVRLQSVSEDTTRLSNACDLPTHSMLNTWEQVGSNRHAMSDTRTSPGFTVATGGISGLDTDSR